MLRSDPDHSAAARSLFAKTESGCRPCRRDDGGGEVNSARKPIFVETKSSKDPWSDWADLAECGGISAPIREEAQIAIQFSDGDPALYVLYDFRRKRSIICANPAGGKYPCTQEVSLDKHLVDDILNDKSWIVDKVAVLNAASPAEFSDCWSVKWKQIVLVLRGAELIERCASIMFY